MQTTNLLLATLRDAPADADVASHKLMLRSGMIRQLAAGIYTWLPLGLRVLRKVEHIIREEMDRAGAQEILMPAMQPAELWQESGRWGKYGPELLRISDRHKRQFCLGPTHEEIMTDLVRREIRSYKQLPTNFYQIQTKFRDEVRPRFGIMRTREFIMKDAYSFHLTEESLQNTYQQMYKTYRRIFDRLGLRYRAVLADSGNIGGDKSHEFHVLADSGEDQIVYTDDGGYAANIELVNLDKPQTEKPAASRKMVCVATPEQHTIEQVSSLLKVAPAECIKTLVVYGTDGKLVSLVIRGDHELNRVKVERLDMILKPLKFASADDVRKATRCDIGSLGPVDSKIPIIVDYSASVLADFVCGANKPGFHLAGVNWGRDLPEPLCADIRNITEGESLGSDLGPVKIARGIEVGHIFQLGTKYSKALKAISLDAKGNSVTLTMGCYGIGVTRILAAAIEQNHDDRGIIWPQSIAPYYLVLVPINMHKSKRLRDSVMMLYSSLTDAGIEVLLDDRRERPGVMFADMELIGIPHRIVISEKGLDNGTLEYKGRRTTESIDIPLESVVEYIKSKIN